MCAYRLSTVKKTSISGGKGAGISIDASVAVTNTERSDFLRSWKSISAIVLCLCCLLSGASRAASQQELVVKISSLTAKVSDLETKTASLTVSQNKLLAKLFTTNLNKTSLFVVGVSTANTAGSQIQVPLSFLLGPSPVVGLQVDIVVPSSYTIVSIVAGPAATVAGKSVTANINGQVARLIIFGLNQTPIFSGLVATMTLQSTASTPKGPNQIVAVSPVATDALGNTVLLTNTSGIVGVK